MTTVHDDAIVTSASASNPLAVAAGGSGDDLSASGPGILGQASAGGDFEIVGLLPSIGGALTAATTIAPTAKAHHVTGTTAIVTITPPAGIHDGETIILIPSDLWSWTAAGNVAVAGNAILNVGVAMTWNATTTKWYPSYTDAVRSVARGGTGAATLTGVLIGNGTGAVTADLILDAAYGGTENGFAAFSGPASSKKTFTLPNASATILTDNAAVSVAQGGTGTDLSAVGPAILGQASAGAAFTRVALRPSVGAALSSGGTIAPDSKVHHVTGTSAVATITVPAGFNDGDSITLIPDGAFTWTTGGNVAVSGTAVVKKAIIMTYDATTTKWYPSYV
ncbi:MAG: hypothetical protein WC538_22145 [Thermoanaerobaculia bacterium]|jgi:hypothetical protein